MTALMHTSAQTKDAFSQTLLVICAHGSAKYPAANEHVLGIADQLRQSGLFFDVQTIFHAGSGNNWEASDLDSRKIDRVIIVPYMMSDGFLAAQMVNQTKEAIQHADIDVQAHGAEAVGTHATISDIAHKLAIETASQNRKSPEDLTLVLVAHGSRNAPQSRLAAEEHLGTLSQSSTFANTVLTFIEEPPFIADTLADITGPAIILGLFAAPGGHAIGDISEAITQSGRDDLINAGPIGLHPDMAELIILRAREVAASSGEIQ